MNSTTSSRRLAAERAGAIAPDAFPDQVFNANGLPQNLALTANFLSLQIFGKFPNELTGAQKTQLSAKAAASVQ